MAQGKERREWWLGGWVEALLLLCIEGRRNTCLRSRDRLSAIELIWTKERW